MKKRKAQRRKARIAEKLKESEADSVVLNEILSNYGNQSKIKEILDKNKEVKKRMKESEANNNMSLAKSD